MRHQFAEHRTASFVDVLDRVLDKGIVIAYRADVSVAGLGLLSVDGVTVVASIATYLRYGDRGLPSSAEIPRLDDLGV